MKTVSEEQAGVQLSGLIDLALQGEEIIITRQDRPVMHLVRVENAPAEAKSHARFGMGKGTLVYMVPDFDAPLEDFREYME